MNDLYLAFSDIEKSFFVCEWSKFSGLDFFVKCVLNQSFGGNKAELISSVDRRHSSLQIPSSLSGFFLKKCYACLVFDLQIGHAL